MNKQAVFHSSDSKYCYAIDEKTIEVFLRTSAEDLFENVSIVYGNKYDYYIKQVKCPMTPRFCDGAFRYYYAKLQLTDVRFVYVFELTEKGKTSWFCEDGIVDAYDFSLAYFNSFQLPYINKSDIMPKVDWLTNAVFYEIFIDRFFSADAEKDTSYVNMAWDEIPNPKSFAGGDLAGIIKKIDYIKSLGVNALYLTPIFTSISNHKYDISDYYQVDKQFGTNETFRKLVEVCHQNGIRVVLDAVFNHCSEKLMQFQDVLQKGKASPYYDWFLIDDDQADPALGNYEYFGVCKYMPKLNTSCPAAEEFLIGIAKHWIEEYDIDGWRLDVSDEVSHSFWRRFRQEVKAIKSDAAIIGENWHDAHVYLQGDQYDSIMNYAITKAMMDYFQKETLDGLGLAHRMSALYLRNTSVVNHMMMNLLDSHDTHRFFTLVDKNVDKLICALALLFVHPGSVCVYYGTEVPMEGGYDPDCRRPMDWSVENEPSAVGKLITALAKLKNHMVIKHGDVDYRYNEKAFVIERTYEDTMIRFTMIREGQHAIIPGKVLLSHNFSENTITGCGFIIEEVRL